MSGGLALEDLGWLDAAPPGWKLLPLTRCCVERKTRNTGNQEANVLSLSYGRIVRRNVESNFGLLPESFETYQIVECGNIILRLTDLQNDKRSLRVGRVTERGIITSAYVCLECGELLHDRYAYYLLHSYDVAKVFYSYGGGVRQSMKFDDFKSVPLFVPPLPTQRAIADFLDKKTAAIDALIEKKQRLLALLAEKRAALINQAVTKGLDPNVPMKDSGVPWIGEIPAHWEVRPVKYSTHLFRGRFSHRPRNDPRLYDGAYPFLQTGSVAQACKYIREYHQTLNEFGKETSREFPVGTLVMAIAANVGDVAITTFPAFFPDSVIGFKPIEMSVDYLYLVFVAMRQALMETATENTQKNLNVELVGGMPMPVPPHNERRMILRYLDDRADYLQSSGDLIYRQIERLQEYRQTLITAVVTGQLDIEEEA